METIICMDVQFPPQQCVRIKEYLLYMYIKLKKIINTALIIVTEIKIKRTFHNSFLKSERDEILVIDNLSLFQKDSITRTITNA